MKVLVTGATGFVGKKLCVEILKKGWQLVVLTRDSKKAEKSLGLPAEFISWQDEEQDISKDVFDGVDSIVNLAGESISQKWTPEIKESLQSSRIFRTRRLFDSLKASGHKLKSLVSASAIGIYGNRRDEKLSEDSRLDVNFLGDLCQRWELEANRFKELGIRTSIFRLGVVLGSGGGALEKMHFPFSIGMGGPIGMGKNYMSWIHVDDLVEMILFAIESRQIEGVYNAVSPNPSRNREFSQEFARSLGRPCLFPIPPFMLKLIFGEMSQILTDSQFVSAEKIEKAGFSFKFPDLRSAFSDLFEIESLKGVKKRNFYQWVDSPRNEVCEFFSEAKNLESITPKWLEFQVQEMSTEKIEKGSLIDYRLKIRGLPVKWRSEISEWNLPSHFVDRQVKGPYRCWHHTHSFSEVEKGTLVEDKVAYKMPFPILGDFVEKLWVSSDVYKIFTHRKKRVEEIFS